jgi:murein DD-endopeptidase MepM/ murein hydrolase activator NlpD
MASWNAACISRDVPPRRFCEKADLLSQCVGKVLGEHDDDHVYLLPFSPNRVYRLIQGYGGAYSHTNSSYYCLDFAMPVGEPVCAARAGTVAQVIDHFGPGGTDPLYKDKGNTIKIRHDDGSVATYLHLHQCSSRVSEGANVVAGDIIGCSGDSGWSSRPHLHFDVRSKKIQRTVPTAFQTIYSEAEILREGRLYARRSASRRLAKWQERFPALFLFLMKVGMQSISLYSKMKRNVSHPRNQPQEGTKPS